MKHNALNTLLFCLAAIMMLAMASCTEKKFHISGNITEAKDSLLYLENMSLNGPVTIDSVKLGDDGSFDFGEKASDAPEFYRLRIAQQSINISIDSTETVTVKAAYPTMAGGYEVSGSDNCSKIKELALLQMGLQQQVNAIAQNPQLGVDAVNDSVMRVIERYKQNVKMNYIYKEPMKSYAYYALFQTVDLGGQSMLLFNPRNDAEDIKVYGAVATSWDHLYPKAERGQNLHNIAIQGMRDVRIMRNEQAQASYELSKAQETGIIDLALQDAAGHVRRLTELKGHVVLLDFHAFSGEGSTKRIMALRELYNKFHARGLEIYQVSEDPDEHFWKTQTQALPWVNVYDANGSAATQYNVQRVPTFFIINKDNVLVARDAQVKDLSAEIEKLL